MISCKETKFDDITVTSHPKIPKNPIVKITDTTETNIGITTNLISLNITKREVMRSSNKIDPNVTKSLFIKPIISSAIIFTPPKNIWALS